MSYIGNEPIVSATRTITEVSATAGQTVFTPNGGYTVGYIDVFVNGAQLQTSDFTATNGTTVTLNSGASAGDDVRLVAWGTFQSANHVAKTGDTMTGNLQINVGGVSYTSYDVNGYPRFSQAAGSAQLGLFRTSNNVGGGYIGGDGTNCFDVRDASFVSRLLVDQSGRVTMPYQPCFSAYSNNTASDNTPQIIVWDLTDINVGSCYNTSNGRFTAPVAGNYRFYATAQGQGLSTQYMEIKFRKNGTDIHTYSDSVIETSSGVHRNATAGIILSLSAGDYVQVFAPNGIRRIQCGFQGYLIG